MSLANMIFTPTVGEAFQAAATGQPLPAGFQYGPYPRGVTRFFKTTGLTTTPTTGNTMNGYTSGGFTPGFTPTPPSTPPIYSTPTTGGGGSLQDPCGYLPSPLDELCRTGASNLPGFGGLNPYPTEGGEAGESCPTGYTKVGGTCVATRPGAYLPGGQPATVPASGTALGTGWEAVQGSFGMPAMTPLPVQRTRLECPAGMVLGKDNLCYPRSTPGLGRRGSFRKWKGERKPKVSAAEWRALQRAERTREKVKEVAKAAGFKVSKRGR